MLAISDARGMVSGSIPGLAGVARVTVDACRTAIAKLEAPDPDSRSKAEEGRRILPVDGGWRIVNYGKYRQMLNDEERAEYKRTWSRKKYKSLTVSDNSDKIR